MRSWCVCRVGELLRCTPAVLVVMADRFDELGVADACVFCVPHFCSIRIWFNVVQR